MRKLLAVLILILPAALYAQDSVSGVVVDGQTLEPLPYATVYLNGTTKGTITDDKGHFELKNVSFPTTVVFSFVGYKTQIHKLGAFPGDLTIKLKPVNNLPEVEVTDKGERERNLAYFKSMFLGEDRWGRRAKIKNPDALMFDGSPDKSVFKAWADEPLIIDMPLLGYELYVNLAGFMVQHINGKAACDILGYFFFKPYDIGRKTERHEKNRRAAYYNSNLHFLRSLYQNRLAENGYVLSAPIADSLRIEGVTRYEPVDIGLHSDNILGDLMRIYGFSDSKLKIQYYHKLDGSPLNLSASRFSLLPPSESGMHLLLDTCTFHRDGIVTDNSIRFTGDISEKRIGASLPDDFDPK